MRISVSTAAFSARSKRRLWPLVIFGLVAQVSPRTARAAEGEAQSSVQRGLQQVAQADFDGALATFDAACSERLTREELLQVLEGSVLVYAALRQPEALQREMRRLASLAPDHQLPETYPPELTTALDQAKQEVAGGVQVVVDANPTAEGVRLRAAAQHDPGALVVGLQIYTRRGTTQPFRLATAGAATTSTLAVVAGQRLDYYAEALGPGQVVVAHAGSATEPRSFLRLGERSASAPPLSPAATTDGSSERDGGAPSPWLWIGIGAGAIAIGVVAAVLLTRGDDDENGTQPAAPTIIGW